MRTNKFVFAVLMAALLVCAFVFVLTSCQESMKGIKLEKSSSCTEAITVSPGDEITYTLTLTNSNAKSRSLTVKDKIPENTSFVSGGLTCENGSLRWKAAVGAGESVSCSYTVRVNNDAQLLGSFIDAPDAAVGDVAASCNSVYVATTLNQQDREKLALGITVITYSEEIAPIALVRSMYNVAFSKIPDINGTPSEILENVFESEDEIGIKYRDMVIPTFYGGTGVTIPEGANFKGSSSSISSDGLIVGDIIVSKNNDEVMLYIFDGNRLLSVSDGCQAVDTSQTLDAVSASSAYAALRPSISLKTLYHYEAYDESSEQLTDAQKALLATAKAYYLRGYRVQYDDSRMSAAYESVNDRGEFRWQIGSYNPEDYTSEKWGYLNCAAFTYELYRNALGYDLGSLYTTSQLVNYYVNSGFEGAPMYPYQYVPTDFNTTEEMRAATQAEFLSTLEVGDLIVVRRSNSSGHVMMYVGNDTVIHSSGSSFSYNNDSETYEPTVRYMNIVGYLFEPTATNYVFADSRYVTRLCIVRPLDKYDGTIPTNTQNRMENLEDILSEKLSSAPEGKTVNAGDDVTFTFRLKNVGKSAKTLTVTELLPSNAVLKDGGGATQSGDKLSWIVTVAPGETKDISYTVTAIGDVGSVIISEESLVGGVLHTCPAVRIATTLTAEQQAAIKAAVEKFRESNPDNIVDAELVNAIYKEAGLESPFVNENGELITGSDLRASVMTAITDGVANGGTVWKLNEESEFCDMLIDGMYGGRRLFTPLRYNASQKINSDRSRLPREQSLTVGDVIVVKFSSSERMFMYIGDGVLVNLSVVKLDYDTYSASTRLMRMISAYHYYFILRPSMG